MQDLGSDAGRTQAFTYACGGSASVQDRAHDLGGLLARVIETRILPQLLLAHGRPSRTAVAASHRAMDRSDAEFAELLLRDDAAPAFAHLDALRRGGLDDVALMVEALAPAARRLGALWEEDECDFVDVTIGVRRLEAMLHELDHDGAVFSGDSASKLLLVMAPGDTHRLGADMAAQLFRLDGWDVERGDDHRLARLAKRHFDAVGFSIACDRYLAGLHEAIARAREISLNRAILVLAGGEAFAANPQLSCELDADYVAADVEDMMTISRTLLKRRELCRG